MTTQEALMIAGVIAAGVAAGQLIYDVAWSAWDLTRDTARRIRDWWDEQPPTTVEDAAPAGDGPTGRPVAVPALERMITPEEAAELKGRHAGDPDDESPGWTPGNAPTPTVRERMGRAVWWATDERLHLAACRFATAGEPLEFVHTLEEARQRAAEDQLTPARCCDPLAGVPALEHAEAVS